MSPYCTLALARIVQESALSVGGNQPHGLVDSPLARDGKKRPVLRGSTLAGCFIASARALFGQLPQAITSGGIESQHKPESWMSSAWRFAHAHPLSIKSPTSFFQHVSIDARTQAAKDDHLFSLEALPIGTSWSFELEIVPVTNADFAELEALAAAVLAAWQQPGGMRLGRGSRHGYGWCRLEDIVIIRLDTRHAHLWPDAFAPERSLEEWKEHFRRYEVEILDLSSFLALHAKPLPEQGRVVVQLSGDIHVGERTSDFGQGYGLDTLSIGGHARMQLQATDIYEHVIAPRGIPFPKEDFDPDFTITALPRPEDGKLIPYVPGASIRGVWRAQLERHYRATNSDPTLLDVLFGSTKRAGCLSVADAMPMLSDDNWKLLWQQHVAIDELTGGVYESAKFDRLCIAYAKFRWQACIDAENAELAEQLVTLLRELLEKLGSGHLPLGGGIWRGHGHVRWTLDTCETRPLSASR